MSEIDLQDPVNKKLVIPEWDETKIITAIQNKEQKPARNRKNLEYDYYYQAS
jgi:hypothetical protein